MTASTRRRPQFHPLTVAKIESLTDDAVAVTFDIPDELIEDYRFKPGQALTLRRAVDGRDERRSSWSPTTRRRVRAWPGLKR